MSDMPIVSTYLKAIDDLSGKILIPASIVSLFVEVGPWFARTQNLPLFVVYIIFVFAGLIGSSLLLLILGYINNWFDDANVQPIVAVGIMPIGFMVAFPQYFNSFPTGLSPVTGIAILVWSFVLLGIVTPKLR